MRNRRVSDRRISARRSNAKLRVFIGGGAIVNCIIATNESRALLFSAAATWEGAFLLWAMTVLGACVLADAVINDLLPSRFHWRVAVRQRHYLLVGMVLCFLGQVFLASARLQSSGLALYCYFNAFMIMWAAYSDAHQRLKDANDR